MKVLFIGVYRDNTGYAHASQSYLLAMDAAGIEVVPRCLKLNNVQGEVPARILELEKQSDKDCNVCIQCCLPHQWDYSGHFSKNVGIFFWETSHFRNSPWAEHINLMDEVWVCCEQNVFAARNSNVNVPTHIIPIPCDINKYHQQYERLNIPESNDKFVFYYIGEANTRKNLPALLKAFHSEFHPHENVVLCLKVNMPGMSPQDCAKNVQEMCMRVKSGLKIYSNLENYHKDVIITANMTELEIMRLHHTCDCYVQPSFGEAWGQPSFDAMAMGKTPLITSKTGMCDWVEKIDDDPDQTPITGGIVVPSHEVPVFGMVDTFDNLYCGNEKWQEISVVELRRHMRSIYEKPEYREQLSNNGVDLAHDYSYEKIGQKIKDILTV